MAATNKQRAQRVIREIKALHPNADYLNGGELFAKFDHYEYPVVYWEAGPYQWALEDVWKLNEKFTKENIDIFVEPQYSFALGIFDRGY